MYFRVMNYRVETAKGRSVLGVGVTQDEKFNFVMGHL